MCIDEYRSTAANEARLRRLARKQGCVLRRSRWRQNSIDNMGGFMIVDPDTNCCMRGRRFDLTPGEVEEWLAEPAG